MTDIDQLLSIVWQDIPQKIEPIDKEELNRIYELLTKDNAITVGTSKDIDYTCLEHSLTDISTPSSTKISYCLRKLSLKERKKNTQHTPQSVQIEPMSVKSNYKKFTKMNVFEEFKPTVLTNDEESGQRVMETFQLIDLSQDSRKLAAQKKTEQ